MEKEIKFNFLPSYHHRFKYLGFGLLFLSILYLGMHSYFEFNPLDIEIVKWMLALSLLVVSGSKKRHERKYLLYIRYYAGKFTLTYMASFVLAFHLANFIGDTGLSFSSLNLIIFGPLMCQGSYFFLNPFRTKEM